MKPEDKDVFYALSDDQATILTVWGEARNQSILGKQLVAQVIDNRATKHRLTPKQVCYQPNQFSCLISTDPNYPKMREIAGDWEKALQSNSSLQECAHTVRGLDDFTTRQVVMVKLMRATFYRVVGTANEWFDNAIKAGKLKKVCVEGSHEFFREVV
jgi:hypothetical protein